MCIHCFLLERYDLIQDKKLRFIPIHTNIFFLNKNGYSSRISLTNYLSLINILPTDMLFPLIVKFFISLRKFRFHQSYMKFTRDIIFSINL